MVFGFPSAEFRVRFSSPRPDRFRFEITTVGRKHSRATRLAICMGFPADAYVRLSGEEDLIPASFSRATARRVACIAVHASLRVKLHPPVWQVVDTYFRRPPCCIAAVKTAGSAS